MSSPRTEPTDRRPDDPVDEPKKSQLSAVQIAAGALASVSAAVVASLFGVAGTLIGAAVASVISTVSAAVYSNSLSRTNERLRQVRVQLAGTAVSRRPAEAAATADEPAAEPATRVLPATLDPRRAPAARRAVRWPRMAGYAVAVFGLAMAIVTGIEIVGQQPVSALVGAQEASSATTLGELTDSSSSRDTTPTPPPPTPAPSTTSDTPASEAPDSDEDAPATPTGSTSESPEETGTSTAEPTGSSDDAPETGQEREEDAPADTPADVAPTP